MAIVCPRCGAEYDVTLFGFGRAIRCACGESVDLGAGHVRRWEASGKEVGRRMAFELRSTAFEDGQPIPRKYTGDGADVSPPLSWSGVPEGTKEFALVCDDPDAPTPEPWVHWVIYKIGGQLRVLPEALPWHSKIEKPITALQGRNSWPSGRTTGYRGPAPPPGHGVHRYHFKLYALGKEIQLAPGVDKKVLLGVLKGHVLGEAELVGTYQR